MGRRGRSCKKQLSVDTAVTRCCLGDTLRLNVMRFFFFSSAILVAALVMNDHFFVQKKKKKETSLFCSSLSPFILKCFSSLEVNTNLPSSRQLFMRFMCSLFFLHSVLLFDFLSGILILFLFARVAVGPHANYPGLPLFIPNKLLLLPISVPLSRYLCQSSNFILKHFKHFGGILEY